MKEQLVHAMQAFIDAAPTFSSYDICTIFKSQPRITRRGSSGYRNFLPWTVDNLPFTLSRRVRIVNMHFKYSLFNINYRTTAPIYSYDAYARPTNTSPHSCL